MFRFVLFYTLNVSDRIGFRVRPSWDGLPGKVSHNVTVITQPSATVEHLPGRPSHKRLRASGPILSHINT